MSDDEHFPAGDDGLDGAGYPVPERPPERPKVEICGTCANPAECHRRWHCEHNPMMTRCDDCGAFLINHGVDGHWCESEKCRTRREEEE